MMWQCHYCRTSLSPETWQKNRQCPSCGSDLHCCKNCVYYDDSKTIKCTEPDSPWVKDRATDNDCTYFEMKMAVVKPSHERENSEAERAKKAFRELFR